MVIIREALLTDNEGLLQLTSLTPMRGKISLRIDRDPFFFNLLNKRGPSQTIVAEDNGILVGCFSVSSIETLVDGNHETVYYLADLKMLPPAGGKVLQRLLNKMYDHLLRDNADLLFCTAAYRNKKVTPLFEGRAGFPEFHHAGIFRVYQIIPLPGKVAPGIFTILETEINDKIIELYNQFYSQFELAPVYSKSCLQETRTIAAFDNGELKACITLADISSSKQNVLIDLPYSLKIAVSLLRLLNKIVFILNLPEIGKPVKVLYVKGFAFARGSEKALDLLIKAAKNLAFQERYCYLTVGIHEKDPLSKHFKKHIHFTFLSEGYLVSLHGNSAKVSKILSGVLYEDYSLV
jgi:hypothetical protein